MPTAGNVSQFLSQLPVPSIIQSPGAISDPNWLRCDGSIITRASYPALSAAMPTVGSFTPTVRAALPSAASFGSGYASIASNGTNMVACTASTGNFSICVSTNYGVTWASVTSGISASCQFSGMALAGSNFVAGVYNATSQPAYCLASSPTTWSIATGVTLGGPGYASIAANSAGLVVMLFNSVGYVSSNSGVSYSASTGLTVPASVTNNTPVVWTGTQFIAFTAGTENGQGGYQSSTSGAASTWSTNAFPPWGIYAISGACSDGAGNVLVVSAGVSLAWASRNGGTTWNQVMLPFNAVGTCSYANGRWFVPMYYYLGGGSFSDGSMAVSGDMYTWFFVQNLYNMSYTANTQLSPSVVYAGGNYCSATFTGTTAIPVTFTENTAQMYLPTSRRSSAPTTGGFWQLAAVTNNQEWIKAA